MSRRLEKVGLAVLVVVVVLAAAQLVRPERTNPKIDFARTFQAQNSSGLQHRHPSLRAIVND